MNSLKIPEDVERGKNYADEILQNLIKEYGNRSEVEKWEWIYNHKRMQYRLRLTIRGKIDFEFVPFFRHELSDVDSTSRAKLRDKVRSIFMSKVIPT